GGIAVIDGDAQRSCSLAELHVSERVHHGPRKVTFPDDAYLEIQDTQAFDALLAATGHRDSAVVRMQQSWRGALAAFAATAIVLGLAYLYGLPLAAEAIAKVLPASTEQAI